MSLREYVIQDIHQTLQYMPNAAYLALACMTIYMMVYIIASILIWLMHCIFRMKKASKDERRKKIMSNIWHMLCCGAFVAYMYMLVMIVYYSRESGSRIGAIDAQLWSTWGITLQEHAYFMENVILFIPFGLLFPLVFRKLFRWCTIPAGCFISMCIEFVQLITGRGYCQLDDVVTNTAGTAIGFVIFLFGYIFWWIWEKIEED